MSQALTESMGPEWALAVGQPKRSAEMDTASRAALTEMGEPELVARCLAGQREAFDVIVERHRRPVYLLCYRFVDNHQDASDLAQDVFVRAYRGLARFRGQSTLATWLHRIAVNVCLNRVGGKKPVTESIEAHQHMDARVDPVGDLLRAERASQVRAAIARLPRKQRATVILRLYHELSHREIAQVLGSSVGAVKANFFHALGNLKKFLAAPHES